MDFVGFSSFFLAIFVLILPVLESLGGAILNGGSSAGRVGDRDLEGAREALEGLR